MDGFVFFLTFLGSLLIFILICVSGMRLCCNRYDPNNRLGRAYRTEFTDV